ncbi:hypothetical protein CEQ90_00210 [Lewinellaceae bacterium SD302]|nr:hypothetical protein CEQ90_00210 [Lewinellaceae bacterium SD302]
MKRAIWRGKILAESDDIVNLEGNAYFPMSSIKDRSVLSNSDTQTYCGWKGDCSYYNVTVDGETNKDAVWYYADPKPSAEEIRDRVAFWKGVEVIDV